MRVLILDTDTEYSGRLRHYCSKRYTQLQFSVCDDPEAAKKLMQESAYDVVLFDAEFDDIQPESLAPLLGRSAFAYISGTNEIVNDCDTIMKYIPVTEMFTKICALYEKKRNRIVRQNKDSTEQEKKTEIITFLPVHGGAGSSTMAAACAMSLSEEADVLYIDLEQCPSDAVFFDGSGKKGISDVISLLKTRYTDPSVVNLLHEVIQKDTKQKNYKVDYIRGYANIMDCLSMTVSCLDTLLRVLREKMNYRFIIIDADLIISPILNKLIAETDKLVFVSSGADVANNKLRRIQRYLEILARDDACEMPEKYLLFNQYYGMKEELTVAGDMEILAKIARYRTGDKTRITSQNILREVLSGKQVFAALKPKDPDEEETSVQ